MGFVWFLLGLIMGGMIGLTIMCLFQINRLNDYELTTLPQVAIPTIIPPHIPYPQQAVTTDGGISTQ